jgi:hypothetical protein
MKPDKPTFYKLFAADGRTLYGRPAWGTRWQPPVKGSLVECRNGYHVCTDTQTPNWLREGCTVWEVETKGRVLDVGDKTVVRTARLVRKIGTFDAPARKAYDEACASALKAYSEACAAAWKAYNEACAPALKAYDEAQATARKAYDEACASALKAHDEAQATARKAYDEARAPAWKAALR